MTDRTHRAVRRGAYGVDAPRVPLTSGSAGIVVLLLGLVLWATRPFGAVWGWAVCAVVLGGCLVVFTLYYLWTSTRGKFLVWNDLLDALDLRGDETVADLGCGRGTVLLLAAHRLTSGRAVGVDPWRSTGSEERTRANAETEGVADRVELRRADLTRLPFGSAEFDVVCCSMALHGIWSRASRATAVVEAARVLRPGGRLLLVEHRGDLAAHAATLRTHGVEGVQVSGLGPRLWFGAPWFAPGLVSGRKRV